MENEEKQNYSTLKEEPIIPPPPISTFPTPAHPLPKFLPKPIALIIIIIFFTVLMAGLITTVYTLGKNSVSNQNTPATVSQTPTPTPNPTANWKTYEGNGFSFKYPSYHEINQDSDTLIRWNTVTSWGDKIADRMYLMTQSSPFKEPISGQIISFNPPFNPNKSYKIKEVLEEETKQIDDIKFKEYAIDCGEDCQYHSAYFSFKGKYFRLEAFTAGGGLSDEFNQILSTFTFAPLSTNKFSDDETANWKTYESSEYDFSIKYPSSVTHETTSGSTQSNTYNQSHEYFKVNGGTLEIYGLCGRGVNPIKTEDIVIAGIKTDKYYETETSGVIKAIDRPAGNGQLCFNFTLPNNHNKDIVDSIFNQILSTFKFE